jgi:2'-5' RNA ligase
MEGTPDTYLRCFIALDISDQIRRNFGDIIDRLKKHDADVKWVHVDNMHLTLKFFGKTPENVLPKIQEYLFNVVLSYNPFYIRIYDIGVFPNRKYPRVIWIGVEESDILKRLHIDIENTMGSLGFKKEQRSFKPHLTLGRVRSQKGIMHLVHDLDTFKDKDFGNIHVKKIKLMKSELKPQGAIYSCLYEIPLGKEETVS